MKSNPLGAMFSDLQNPDQKYATVVLESISCLETTQNLFLKQNNLHSFLQEALHQRLCAVSDRGFLHWYI